MQTNCASWKGKQKKRHPRKDVFFCPYDGLLTGHLTNHCFLGFIYEICYPFYGHINL